MICPACHNKTAPPGTECYLCGPSVRLPRRANKPRLRLHVNKYGVWWVVIWRLGQMPFNTWHPQSQHSAAAAVREAGFYLSRG